MLLSCGIRLRVRLSVNVRIRVRARLEILLTTLTLDVLHAFDGREWLARIKPLPKQYGTT